MKNIKLLLAVLFIVSAGCSKPPADSPKAGLEKQPIDQNHEFDRIGKQISERDIEKQRSSFEFTGYGVGKSHNGTFEILNVTLFFSGTDIIGFKGVINAKTVNTGIGGLDKHLRNSDFFDVEKYPEIVFNNGRIHSRNEGELVATGMLSFRGVTNSITFPVKRDESSISSEFLLDTSLYGMVYTGVNKEVLIKFKFSL